VLFINAAEHFVRGEAAKPADRPAHRDIVTTYQYRKEQDRYARRVSMKEIAEKDYNLSLSRYVSTALEKAGLTCSHARRADLDRLRYQPIPSHSFGGKARIPFTSPPPSSHSPATITLQL